MTHVEPTQTVARDDEMVTDDSAVQTYPDDQDDAQAMDVQQRRGRKLSVIRLLGFGVLPAVAIALGAAAGMYKFHVGQAQDSQLARIQSLQAASEGAVAMLSYNADNVDKVLPAAEDRLTGAFRDSYNSLINQVVIPGAKEKKISATASVPAAATTFATPNHAVVMVYINQAIVMGADAPTNTASAIQVTLDKVHDQWLISAFEPK